MLVKEQKRRIKTKKREEVFKNTRNLFTFAEDKCLKYKSWFIPFGNVSKYFKKRNRRSKKKKSLSKEKKKNG